MQGQKASVRAEELEKVSWTRCLFLKDGGDGDGEVGRVLLMGGSSKHKDLPRGEGGLRYKAGLAGQAGRGQTAEAPEGWGGSGSHGGSWGKDQSCGVITVGLGLTSAP